MSLVTVSGGSFTDEYNYGGLAAVIRIYYTKSFLGSLNESVIGGQIDGTGFYDEIACTVVDNVLTYPSFTLVATLNSSKPSAKFYGVLYSEDGARRENLFGDSSGWIVRPSPTTVTRADLINYQGVRIVNPPASYADLLRVISLIETAVGTLNDATDSVKGRTTLSVSPVGTPKAWGINDYALGYHVSKFSSLAVAVAAVSAASVKTPLYLDTNVTTNNLTIPATVQLIPAGGIITVNSGQTLTCLAYIPPIAQQIFAGSGTLTFSGNNNINEYFAEWVGAVGDGATDDGPKFNKIIIARPTHAPIRVLPNRNYALITGISNNGGPLAIIGSGVIGESGSTSVGAPSFTYKGSAGGTMISCTGTNYIRLIGFSMFPKSGSSEADNAIKINNPAATGPEAKTIIDNLFIDFDGVRSTFVGINLSETATNNLENTSITNSVIYASNDESTSNPSRGICVKQGANANAINVTVGPHVWLRAASVGLKMIGGCNIALRDSFVTACDVGVATGTDIVVDNVRFENVRTYHQNLGGDQNVTYHKNYLDLYGLSAAVPAFDLTSGNVLLHMLNNKALGECNAAQVFFDVSGGSGQSRLVSRLNNYPTTSNLIVGTFGVIDGGADFGLAQDSFFRTSMTGPIDRHADPTSNPDPLLKTQINGAAIYTRFGQIAEDGDWLTNIFKSLGTFSKDNALKGGWHVQQLPAATLDTSNHYRISYYPIGSVTPTIVFDLDGAGTLALLGNLIINTNKFTVAASSGNTSVGGTLGITGNLDVNTNKFNVAASNGNTAIAGTLGVAGASSLSSVAVGSGTTLTKVVKGTVTINPSSINANTVAVQTFTLTGAVVGDTLILNIPAAGLTAGLLVQQVWVSAADTIKISFHNSTGAPIDEASASWNYTLIRS